MTKNNAAEGQNCMLVKLILFYRNSGDWMFGGGGIGAQNFVCSSALPKQQLLAAIESQGILILSSTNYILPLELLIGFLSS